MTRRSFYPILVCVFSSTLLACPDPSNAQETTPKVTLGKLIFSKDGSLILTGGDKPRIFETSSGKLLREFRGVPWFIAFSPAVREVCAIGREGGGTRIWNIDKPDVICALSQLHEKAEFIGEYRDFQCEIDISGRYIARCCTRYNKFDFPPHFDEGRFRLSDTTTGNDLQSIDIKDGGVQAAAFSGNGKLVAYFCNRDAIGSTIEIYRVQPWELVASIQLPTGTQKGNPYGTEMKSLGSGQQFMVAGGVLEDSGPGEFKGTRGYVDHGLLWKIDLTAQPVVTLMGDPIKNGHYESIGVSPDGLRFVTLGGVQSGGQRMIEMREVATRKLLWKADYGYQPTISPDGKYVGVTVSPEILLLNAETGELVRKFDASK